MKKPPPSWTKEELMRGVPQSLPARAPNALKPWKRAAVVRLLKLGKSMREVTKATGTSQTTVTKIRREMQAESGPVLCECGQPSTHHGWCRFRYRKSPKRQATMRRLHAEQRSPKLFQMLAAASAISNATI